MTLSLGKTYEKVIQVLNEENISLPEKNLQTLVTIANQLYNRWLIPRGKVFTKEVLEDIMLRLSMKVKRKFIIKDIIDMYADTLVKLEESKDGNDTPERLEDSNENEYISPKLTFDTNISTPVRESKICIKEYKAHKEHDENPPNKECLEDRYFYTTSNYYSDVCNANFYGTKLTKEDVERVMEKFSDSSDDS